MALRKGKLRNNDGVVDSSGYTPRLSMQGSRDIVEVKEESWFSIAGGWIKGIIAFVLSLIVIIAGIYSGLAATLMFYSPISSDSSSRSLIIRNAWVDTGNEPPIGEEVIISTDSKLPEEWWNAILVGWVGISSPAKVEILTPNFDKLYIEDGTVVSFNDPDETFKPFVSSAAFKYDKKENPVLNHQLDGQYLVKCISGDCKEGTYFIIEETQIFGKLQDNK